MSRFTEVLYPSISSSITVSVGVTLLLLTQLIPSLNNNAIVGNLLGGTSASINEQTGTISAFTDSVFSNVTLNKILFFCLWLLVGLGVYLIVALVLKSYSGLNETLQQLSYPKKLRNQAISHLATRLVVQATVVILNLIYIMIFVRFLLPLSFLCFNVTIQLVSISGLIYTLSALIVLWVSLHLQVIFTRLFFMRVRLFGAADPSGSSWHS